MLDVLRYRSLLVVGLALAAAALFTDLLLRLAFGWTVPAMERAAAIDPRALDDVGRAVGRVQAERMQRPAEGGRLRPLAAVLGLSTARQGVDPAVLDSEDGRELDWHNFSYGGLSAYQLERYVQPLFAASLPLEVVVLVVNPAILGGHVRSLREESSVALLLREAKEGRTPTLINIQGQPLTWLRDYENGVSASFQTSAHSLRDALLPALGVPIAILYPGTGTTAAGGARSKEGANVGRAPADYIEGQYRMLTESGWFEPASYQRSSVNAAAMRRLLRSSLARAREVLVVMPPEPAPFRARVPPQAERLLRELVGELPGAQVRLVDLREALAEEAYYDVAHTNLEGRVALSRLLAAQLRVVPGAAAGPAR